MIDERMARMGLAAAHDAGTVGLSKLVKERGAQEVWEHLRSGRGQTAIAARAAEVDLEDLARQTQEAKTRFIIPGDDEWPSGLEDLSWSEAVGGVGGEPIGLWVKGAANLAGLGTGVAVVGSRAYTGYGAHIAADWAAGLVEKGYVVVSGGAFGIDASAHGGAMAAGGVTIALMAAGLAKFYPKGNEKLITQVTEKGAVISEYPPLCTPGRPQFLVRNRLIAAISKATVIVEGALRSGAQNTVSWALSMGRPVMAAPGPVTSATSVTPHRLIRNGEAILVSNVEEIVAVLGPIDTSIPNYKRERGTLFDALTEEQKKLHDALPPRRGTCVDELSILTGQPALSLLVGLAQLKQLGLVEETKPGIWALVPRGRMTP